jgi:predicted transport protein
MNVIGSFVLAGLAYLAYAAYRTNKAMADVLEERKRELLMRMWSQIQESGDQESEIAKTVQRLLQDGHSPKQQAQ